MTRRFVYLLTICFFVFPILSFIPKNKIVPIAKSPVKTVIIDPGHGGSYPGARGLISSEKEVSLSVALKFGKALQEAFPDLKIVYTRTSDENAGDKTTLKEDLRYRADLANFEVRIYLFHFTATRQVKSPVDGMKELLLIK